MSSSTGLYVGIGIAAAVVLILAGAAISYVLAQRRRIHKKPRRAHSISGFIYDDRGQRKRVQGQRVEDVGLLEEATLEPFSDLARPSVHEHRNSLGPIVRPAEPHLHAPHSPPASHLIVPTRTGSASPLLKTLPPLSIPSSPRNIIEPPAAQRAPSPPPSEDSASVYSQTSATTNMHYRFTHEDQDAPPVPPLPLTIPELPPHLRFIEPVPRSDSRATLQRGDTRVVSNLLQSRALRYSHPETPLSRNVSRIERNGSIRDPRLTGAFHDGISSVGSSSPIQSVSEHEVPYVRNVSNHQTEPVHIQALRIPSEKAKRVRNM